MFELKREKEATPVFRELAKKSEFEFAPEVQFRLGQCLLAGGETSEALRERSLAIYEEARARAWERGLVLADTKFEFGWIGGQLTLIDEALSPDSSRYWDRAQYESGNLLSFDKQFVRDWLDASGWNHEPPAPALPAEVVAKTQERYLEAIRRLSGGAK